MHDLYFIRVIMNTKSVGNIGEACVLAKFVSLGIQVYQPFGDNEKSDLVAEFDGKLQKIQVKTSVGSKNGVIRFRTCSSHRHTKSDTKTNMYTKDDVDYFALYSIERNLTYLVSVEEVSTTEVSIRFEDTKNKQSNGVRTESDYLIDNFLKLV